MTKTEQRILIAKDVIAQLRAGKFVAKKGRYAVLPRAIERRIEALIAAQLATLREVGTPYDEIPGIELQSLVREAKACRVCAQGGLVLAAIDRFNSCKLTRWVSTPNDVAADKDSAPINRFFSADALADIEAAFEAWALNGRDGRPWRRAYKDPTDRMDAIMRNIINNDGTFDITRIPKPRKTPISNSPRR